MKDVKNFLLSLYNDDGSFSFSSANRIGNLYSTCFGVMCLDLIGELKLFKDREKLVFFIQKYQDEKTGYFKDPTAISEEGTIHDNNYILLQLTDFAQLALSALGTAPKYKYKFLEKYKNNDFLKKWFYGLNWKNPWLVSNEIMFILNYFIYEDEKENRKYINYIISLLNKNQSPMNGFWNLGKRVDYHNQMAGAYHFIIFYMYLDIKPNYIEKIIESTLAIQNYDGLFSYATGGGSCDDLDAINLLCWSTVYTNHKNGDIIRVLERSYRALLNNQNEDGGFCWAKRERNIIKLFLGILNFRLIFNGLFLDLIDNGISKIKMILLVIFKKDFHWKYSGLDAMKIKNEDSDLFSTWFRMTSVAFIEKTFSKICNNEASFNWNLRKDSGLGFYKRQKDINIL